MFGFFAWKTIGSTLLRFLREAWPILLLVVLTIFATNHFYYKPRIENLKLELSLSEKNLKQAHQIIKDQNDSIRNLSETSAKVTKEFLENLNNVINDMSEDNRRVIKSILDSGVPEGCDASRQFLIEMIDRLQWDKGNE